MVITHAVYVKLNEGSGINDTEPDEAPKGSGINDRPAPSGAPTGQTTTPKLDDNTAKPGDFASKADAMFRKNGRWGCSWDSKGNPANAAAKSAAEAHKAKPKK